LKHSQTGREKDRSFAFGKKMSAKIHWKRDIEQALRRRAGLILARAVGRAEMFQSVSRIFQ
jgi:hypothetical protein